MITKKQDALMDLFLNQQNYVAENVSVQHEGRHGFIVTGAFSPEIIIKFEKVIDGFEVGFKVDVATTDAPQEFLGLYSTIAFDKETKAFWSKLGELAFEHSQARRDTKRMAIIQTLKSCVKLA